MDIEKSSDRGSGLVFRVSRFAGWLAAFTLAVLSLTACGENDRKSSEGDSNTKVLTAAGGAGPGAPYHIVDATTKAQSGIMVELLNAIGKDAGFKVNYVEPIVVADLIPSVVDGKIDVIANNLGITPERQKTIAFSIPFFNAKEALLVHGSDKTKYERLEDLKGEVVGAVHGSLYEAALLEKREIFDDVKLYGTTVEVAEAVRKREVKAGVLSSVPVEYALSKGHYKGLKISPTYKETLTSQLGIGLSKDRPELKKRIDTSLAKLMADGTVAKIFAKYGITWSAP
jgi:polar amino acid transport system substrate-binding protein